MRPQINRISIGSSFAPLFLLYERVTVSPSITERLRNNFEAGDKPYNANFVDIQVHSLGIEDDEMTISKFIKHLKKIGLHALTREEVVYLSLHHKPATASFLLTKGFWTETGYLFPGLTFIKEDRYLEDYEMHSKGLVKKDGVWTVRSTKKFWDYIHQKNS